MNGNNAAFRLNPATYMGQKLIYSYNAGKTMDGKDSLNETINAKHLASQFSDSKRKCRIPLEFDLVPIAKYPAVVDLKILGAQGAYAQTSRKGAPIIAGWIPFINEDTNDASKFGYIPANSVPGTVQYIFTVGLGGCTIVAVDRGPKGIYFYHEPTKAAWNNLPVYPDGNQVLVRALPALAGSAIIRRSTTAAHGWEILVQDANGFTSGGVTAYPV
ncbi:hypothetical protein ACQE3E_16305 [Methylomonas sp. MED-D]|uniref:hypothetical protein n=1 Tax=unclassified Methylomonas TaxID=2608980 RepID=UPI00143BA3E6|nr:MULTISPECIES: hypothetical protein [unclassified Methylomonas]MDT4331079.1 hypothetical protein [Methylomonas sp. MV1]NJA04911.1 hypothetical protein [Methylococcaceae bacterium WWC4]WGS84761.1 hypothetical protein QC632_17080 [Methylomonas sp. UP202]